MPNVTPAEFREWESHPVTLAVKEAIKERVNQAKDHLAYGVGNDHEFDLFLKGMVRAFTDVLDASPALAVGDEESPVEV